MADTQDTFSAWLAQAQIAEARLTAEQLALLQAAFQGVSLEDRDVAQITPGNFSLGHPYEARLSLKPDNCAVRSYTLG